MVLWVRPYVSTGGICGTMGETICKYRRHMLNIKCRKMVNNLDLPFQARSKTDLFGMIMKIIHNLVL